MPPTCCGGHAGESHASMTAALDVRSLDAYFQTVGGEVQAVRDVSFTVAPGEIVGIVGESGSGKSVTALAIMGLLPGRPVSGERIGGGRQSRPTWPVT